MTTTDSGPAIDLGTERIELHAVYVSTEERLDPPPPHGDLSATQAHVAEAVDGPDVNKALVPRRLGAWVQERWTAAADRWWLFGEPCWTCEHDPDGPRWWFVRWPSVSLCPDCGPKVTTALHNDPALTCDNCQEPGREVMVMPGRGMVAVVVLCRVCEG